MIKRKYPIDFRCSNFKVTLVGTTEGNSLEYITFETNACDGEEEYVGSFDRDTGTPQLKKLRDALTVLIKQKARK